MVIFMLTQKMVLKGNKIRFPSISVGATENAIIAAVMQKAKLFYLIVPSNQKYKI